MTLHRILTFEREVPASTEKVFEAIADPVARSQWGAPSDTAAISYDEADFQEAVKTGFDNARRVSRISLSVPRMLADLPLALGRGASKLRSSRQCARAHAAPEEFALHSAAR